MLHLNGRGEDGSLETSSDLEIMRNDWNRVSGTKQTLQVEQRKQVWAKDAALLGPCSAEDHEGQPSDAWSPPGLQPTMLRKRHPYIARV